jgi:hypothetical protein
LSDNADQGRHSATLWFMTNPAAGPPSSEEPSSDPQGVKIELVWPEDIGADAQPVNQVVVSFDQAVEEVVYLYLGHVSPPPWVSGDIGKRIQELGYKLPVTPKGSFILSRTRAEELWTVLGRHLGKLPR